MHQRRTLVLFLLIFSLYPLSLLAHPFVLVLSPEDLEDAHPDDFGVSQFQAKVEEQLDPGSWSPIFEPTSEAQEASAYYSAVERMVTAVTSGDRRMLEEAAGQIEAAAVEGDPHAQSVMGFLYGMGIMRERNKAKAFLYHYSAAEGGNAQSKMVLAYGYGRQEEYEKAVKLYAELAEIAVNSYLIPKDLLFIEPFRIQNGAGENKEALRKSRGEEDEDFQVLEYQAQKGNSDAMYKLGLFSEGCREGGSQFNGTSLRDICQRSCSGEELY